MVVNPHKWLFTPFDLSAFYCRHMDTLRAAFSLTPDYLQTLEAVEVRNLMDTGVQLGRRFRSLKLWAILRHFGSDGIRERLGEHMRLARLFAGWVDESPDFERLAPVPFSVVCFRATPRGDGVEDAHDAVTGGATGDAVGAAGTEADALNERLLEAVNATGEVLLSHTRLNGRFTIRLAVGHVRTQERHVRRAWELLDEKLRALR